MNLDKLTKGERFIVDWQYKLAGDFKTALSHAIMTADSINIEKLRMGFPEEVEAYLKFSREDGWWQKVLKKMGVKDEQVS
jgi:hypothetical protein